MSEQILDNRSVSRHHINSSQATMLDTAVRSAISNAIHRSKINRDELARKLSARSGLQISAHMLNSYSAESKRATRFPALLVSAFCEIVSNDALQKLLLNDRQRLLLEFAELSVKTASVKKIEAARQQLLAELEEITPARR